MAAGPTRLDAQRKDILTPEDRFVTRESWQALLPSLAWPRAALLPKPGGGDGSPGLLAARGTAGLVLWGEDSLVRSAGPASLSSLQVTVLQKNFRGAYLKEISM